MQVYLRFKCIYISINNVPAEGDDGLDGSAVVDVYLVYMHEVQCEACRVRSTLQCNAHHLCRRYRDVYRCVCVCVYVYSMRVGTDKGIDETTAA